MSEISRKTIFVPGPVQNLSLNIHKPNKFIGTFTSVALQSLYAKFCNAENKYLASFNCCGIQLDREYNSIDKPAYNRFQFESDKIGLKLSLFRQLGINNDFEIWRDDSLESINWIQKEIKRLFISGAIYTEMAVFNVCKQCGNSISLDEAKATQCVVCEGKLFVKDKRIGLFTNFPTKKDELVRGKLVLPKNQSVQKMIFDMYKHLPDRVFINRRRNYGISLSFLDIPGLTQDFLDPEVSLSFMPAIISELYDYDTVIQIQSMRTALRVIPFTSLFNTRRFADKYLLTQYISDISLKEVEEKLSINFYVKYLPLFLLNRSTDIPNSQIYQLVREYQSFKFRYLKLLSFLENRINTEQEFNFDKEDILYLDEIRNNFLKLNMREGVLMLRKFLFNTLSPKYVQILLDRKANIREEDIVYLSNIFSWIFNMN
jgi:DNA-directed RNA polymerase subunit RPC12/RpoP